MTIFMNWAKSFFDFLTNRFTLIGIALGMLIFSFPVTRFFRMSTFDFGSGRNVTIVSTLTDSFKSIAELNTLRVSMSGVVEGVDESFWGDNKVLIVAQGYAVYGVDLSTADIVVTPDAVTITVSEPVMNEAFIDMQDSYVYENEFTGLRVHDEKAELLNDTWKNAQDRMIELSLHPRNLDMAKRNLEVLIEGLVEPHIEERELLIDYRTLIAQDFPELEG
tara:strand:+ start:2764 stop:3423 length:660 start_codon:yes stop_codon:yes gene_type:complete